MKQTSLKPDRIYSIHAKVLFHLEIPRLILKQRYIGTITQTCINLYLLCVCNRCPKQDLLSSVCLNRKYNPSGYKRPAEYCTMYFLDKYVLLIQLLTRVKDQRISILNYIMTEVFARFLLA